MSATALGTIINSYDTEWIGVIHSQAPNFFRGYIDETIRNRILLAMLRSDGRIMLNANGPLCVWDIKFDQQTTTATSDGAANLDFTRSDLIRQAALNWRGYVATDAYTEKEVLMNKGAGDPDLRYAEVLTWLMEALTDKFGDKLFGDGEADATQIHGLESIFATGTTVAADLIGKPSDSYAGLSTALAAEGGTWSAGLTTFPNANVATDWPHGTGDYKYDFFSPKVINWSSTNWGTSAVTWEANCERAISQGMTWLTHTGGPKGRPKLGLLSSNLMQGFMNHQRAKGRIIIPHKESQDLGFSDTLNFEGAAIKSDYSVPVNIGYLLNTANMELASLDKVLFGYRGPDYYIKDSAWLLKVGYWGNMRLRVKHQGKLKNVA